jgi:hypothetical protein
LHVWSGQNKKHEWNSREVNGIEERNFKSGKFKKVANI